MTIKKSLIAITALLASLLAMASGSEDEIAVRTVLFPFQHAILSAMVEGAVSSIHLREGESFEVGDVLLNLDDTVYAQRLKKAEAALAQAELDVEFARKNLERCEELRKKEVSLVGDPEYDRAKLDLGSAQTRRASQQADLEISRKDFANCSVNAAFSGRIARRLIQPGELARAGMPLLQILDDSKLLAAMQLPSYLRSQVKIGDTLEIAVEDRPGRTYSGTVFEISGDIDAASRTFELKLMIDNSGRETAPEERLIAGMSGHLLTPFADFGKLPAKKSAEEVAE